MAGRSRGVVLSFVYWSLRRMLELVVLRRRSEQGQLEKSPQRPVQQRDRYAL